MLELYKQALLDLKRSIENNLEFDRTEGICFQLYKTLGNSREYSIKQFCLDAFIAIYGSYSTYPVEGSEAEYLRYSDKYSPDNPYSLKRLELLDAMIRYCGKTKLYELSYESEYGHKFIERSPNRSGLFERARNIHSVHGGNYSIK